MKDKNIRNILITSTGVIVLGVMLIFFTTTSMIIQ